MRGPGVSDLKKKVNQTVSKIGLLLESEERLSPQARERLSSVLSLSFQYNFRVCLFHWPTRPRVCFLSCSLSAGPARHILFSNTWNAGQSWCQAKSRGSIATFRKWWYNQVLAFVLWPLFVAPSTPWWMYPFTPWRYVSLSIALLCTSRKYYGSGLYY